MACWWQTELGSTSKYSRIVDDLNSILVWKKCELKRMGNFYICEFRHRKSRWMTSCKSFQIFTIDWIWNGEKNGNHLVANSFAFYFLPRQVIKIHLIDMKFTTWIVYTISSFYTLKMDRSIFVLSPHKSWEMRKNGHLNIRWYFQVERYHYTHIKTNNAHSHSTHCLWVHNEFAVQCWVNFQEKIF